MENDYNQKNDNKNSTVVLPDDTSQYGLEIGHSKCPLLNGIETYFCVCVVDCVIDGFIGNQISLSEEVIFSLASNPQNKQNMT